MCAACLPCDPWNWVVLLPHPTLTFSADNVDEEGDKGGDKGRDKGEYEVEIIVGDISGDE